MRKRSNAYKCKKIMHQCKWLLEKSKWWEENSNETGEINYGSFKLSGTFEQGGYICPKCGYCNNAYSFEHICQKCGYTTK